MGLDMAWAPHTPFSKVPLTVGVGAVSDKVIVVDGKAAVSSVSSHQLNSFQYPRAFGRRHCVVTAATLC
jgi:hypothetical protein